MGAVVRFHDRRDAGRRLATAVSVVELVDPLILGLPRGGVPVAFEVAAALGATLDALVARKVGAPGNPEFGIGAIAENGVRVANPAALDLLGLSDADFERLADAKVAELDRRVVAYRGQRPLPAMYGRDVVVVDDGLATGMTAEAALGAARRAGARRLVLAAPVCARDTARRLDRIADVVVCVSRPNDFRSVGQWYDNFDQTSDAEVIECLERGTPPPGTAP